MGSQSVDLVFSKGVSSYRQSSVYSFSLWTTVENILTMSRPLTRRLVTGWDEPLCRDFTMTMFYALTTELNLYLAYKKTLRGQGKFRTAAIEFSRHETRNLMRLLTEIREGRYCPGTYVNFVLYEPVERSIHAPRYRDKIVQHMVNNVIAPYFTKRFIPDSYACIVGKGNERAVLQIQKYMRRAKWQYGDDYYIVKVDISKFFRSIDRETLKVILARQLDCKKTMELLFKIIDSAPEDNGLPLGNLTSQVLANLYMNELDQYIKRNLKVRYYVRYADDLFLFVRDKKEARDTLTFISEYATKHLKLQVHPTKSTIIRPNNGLEALGFKVFTTHILLRYDTKIRIRRRIRHIPRSIAKGMSVLEIERSLNSWYAFAKTAKIHHFIRVLINTYPYIYLNKKGNIRIDESMLPIDPHGMPGLHYRQ